VNKFLLRACKFNAIFGFAMTQHSLKLTANRLRILGIACLHPSNPEVSDRVRELLTSNSQPIQDIFTFYERCAVRDIEMGEIAAAAYVDKLPVTAGALVELFCYAQAGFAQCVARIDDKRWLTKTEPFPSAKSI
jgi:hypothetical protein